MIPPSVIREGRKTTPTPTSVKHEKSFDGVWQNNTVDDQLRDFTWKLASIEKLVEANKRSPSLTKTVVEAPQFLERLRNFKCTGRVTLESGTNFWSIVLNDNWQQQHLRGDFLDEIRHEKAFNREDYINQAESQAKEWGKLLGLSSICPDFFKPTSQAGMHVSMGLIKPEETPDFVVDGKMVSFTIKGFTTMPYMRALPIIYPAQRTTEIDGVTFMDFPTRWYFLDVDVEDFDFNFKYQPHVSLACYGLKKVPLQAVVEMHEALKAVGARDGDYEYGKK